MPLLPEDREELGALAMINDTLKGPSSIMRFHWRSQYCRLVRRGLVTWGDPPYGLDRKLFAGIAITVAGRDALREAA